MAISTLLETKVERTGTVRKAQDILADIRAAERDMSKLYEELESAMKQRQGGKKNGR